MLGSDQRLIFQIYDYTAQLDNMKGIVAELKDCAFPLVDEIICTDSMSVAFKDADYSFLIN
jgi:malate dehydrogenase